MIQGVGDFNGDGKADILWRDVAGLVDIWFMNGPDLAGVGTQYDIDPSWAIQ